ncbi:MAG: hypothetical protein HVN34_09460 [Methanobacteriaceae archaeon]|jgi:IS1 family transposase|nr:hypothetical protein [Methanobacteriaceae archaeon]NYB27529.1 hypothetical protein [Methanobacteriaceae archaeon]OPY21032.1 MAG: IS1 transposase [Methanobacterium sp. PtaU1.Bin097]
MEHESEDERWIWLSFVSEHRLILGAYAGPMTQDSADRIIQITGEKINEKKLPIFITDGRKYYAEALLKRYGEYTVFPKTGKRGRPRKPRQMPLEELKYAQVIKTREGGKVINIQRKIIFGEKEDIDESIISTAYIERQNLTLRQDNNRLTRKTIGYSKKDEWLQHQTTLQITNHNFIRTHESLKIVDKKQIKGKTWKKYRKQTPTMSIGITDHIWTLKELLTYPYHQELQPIKGS